MRLLFIVNHDTNASIDQVLIFVPDDYDRAGVREKAQEFGIPNPQILVTIEVSEKDAERLRTYADIDEYVLFAR